MSKSVNKKYRLFFILLFLSILFSKINREINCNYLQVNNIYFNENILSYYFNFLDNNNPQVISNIFLYEVLPLENCNVQNIKIDFTLKLFSPEIGINQYEVIYNSELISDISLNSILFSNNDFDISLDSPDVSKKSVEKIISYISYSGSLPNGIYSFDFIITDIDDSNNLLSSFFKKIEIQRPEMLNLLFPGGEIDDLAYSYIYSTLPVFTWSTDYCDKCTFGIRISEYNSDKHGTLLDALNDNSHLPYGKTNDYYEIPWNVNSFKYPIDEYRALEFGKYYVWQIRRAYETIIDTYYDFSPIFVFEIRVPNDREQEIVDPYLSVIKLIIGNEQYDEWFGLSGELEKYISNGEFIWLNGQKLHIETLYSIASDIKRGKVKIKEIQIEK